MSPNDADGIANSVDPDQTAPLGAVWSGSALFAQTCLSENLGKLRYMPTYKLWSTEKCILNMTKNLEPGDPENCGLSIVSYYYIVKKCPVQTAIQ